MRVLTDQTSEFDYLEIILSDEDIENLNESFGISKDFKNGLHQNTPLNVFLRQETLKEKVDSELDYL